MAALMSFTSPCVFCCISRNFAVQGRSVTLIMDHGTIACLIFGLIKATLPPRKTKERMRQMCALCCQKRSNITGCGESYCDECIDAHTCGEKIVY